VERAAMCSNASKLFLLHAGLVLVTTIPKVFSSGAPQHALVNSPSTPAAGPMVVIVGRVEALC
jgi:hypothetical protein